MIRLLRGLFITIPVLWVVVAHIGPLLVMLRISILARYPTAAKAPLVYDAHAYQALWEGTGYQNALGHSLITAALATGIAFALAWPLAWYVAIRVPPARQMRRLALLIAPFWTSEVLRMFALILLLANRGALNAVLQSLGLTDRPILLLYGTGAVLAGIVYTVFLTMLLPLFAALNRLPGDLLDAAADLGATAWQRQIAIVLPLTAGGISAGVALTFLLCLGVLAAPALLGGAGTPTFAAVIAGFFAGASGRWPMGAAFSLVLLITGTACAAALACSPQVGTRSGPWPWRLRL